MLERRSALASHPQAKPGTTLGVADGDAPSVSIAERPSLAVLQVSAFADSVSATGARLVRALDLALPEPGRYTGDAKRNLRAIGPGVWQLVASDGGLPAAGALRATLEGVGTIVDLSHARAALRVAGREAERALAKHCPLDLATAVFAPGSATQTRFGHLGLTLARLDDLRGVPVFELLVFRGYAEYVFEALLEGAAEFGVRVESPLEQR